jgi:hypothetical protein
LCSDSAFYNPSFVEFLDKPFLSSTVREAVIRNYVFMPLPYHHEAWVVTKLAPYFIDHCIDDPANCKYEAYIDYTFKN